MTRPAAVRGTRAELENRLQKAIDVLRELERSTQIGDQALVAVAREVRTIIVRELKRRRHRG